MSREFREKNKDLVNLEVVTSGKDTKLKELNAFDIQKALNNVKLSRTRVDVYNIYHASLKMAFNLGFLDKDLRNYL